MRDPAKQRQIRIIFIVAALMAILGMSFGTGFWFADDARQGAEEISEKSQEAVRTNP